MFARPLPRSAPYFEYFERQNSIMQEMAKLLVAIVDAEQDAEACLKRMARLESEADELQHTIIHELSQTFITPIDREDIYAISTAQERTIDSLNGLGTRFFLFSFVHVRFPAKKMILNIREMTRAIGDLLQSPARQAPSLRPRGRRARPQGKLRNAGGGRPGRIAGQRSRFVRPGQAAHGMGTVVRPHRTNRSAFFRATDTLEQAVLKYA